MDKGVRKFQMAILTKCLVFVGFLLCKPWGSGRELFGDFCMALVASSGVFASANVVEKMKAAK